MNKLQIANMPTVVDLQMLTSFIHAFLHRGSIQSIEIDSATSTSLVTFKNETDARKALKCVNGNRYRGATLKAELVSPPEQSQPDSIVQQPDNDNHNDVAPLQHQQSTSEPDEMVQSDPESDIDMQPPHDAFGTIEEYQNCVNHIREEAYTHGTQHSNVFVLTISPQLDILLRHYINKMNVTHLMEIMKQEQIHIDYYGKQIYVFEK